MAFWRSRFLLCGRVRSCCSLVVSFRFSVARGPFCSWAGLPGALLLRGAVGFGRALAGCSASGLLLFASALVLWLGPVWAGGRLARSPLVVWRRRLPFVVVKDCSL